MVPFPPGVQESTAGITAALCDVTSDVWTKTSDKSVLVLVSNSPTPRSSGRHREVTMLMEHVRGSRMFQLHAGHKILELHTLSTSTTL